MIALLLATLLGTTFPPPPPPPPPAPAPPPARGALVLVTDSPKQWIALDKPATAERLVITAPDKPVFGWPKSVVVGAEGDTDRIVALAARAKLAGVLILSPKPSPAALKQAKSLGPLPMLIVTTQADKKDAEALYAALGNRDHAVVLQVAQRSARGTAMFGKVPRLAERLAEWAAIRLGKKIGP